MAVLLLAAIVLSGLTFRWVRQHTPAPATPATGMSGTLVYAVPDGAGWARLWTWDLDRNVVAEGPRVQDPVELVDAYGAGPGWIGVTWERIDGSFEAGLLRYLEPTDEATPLLTADYLAWGARGEDVAGASIRREHGCRRRVKVVDVGLAPSSSEVRVDRTICGAVLSIGRDDLRTYLTLSRRGDPRIVFAGLGRFHRVLDGYALSAISPTADMLVVPASELPPAQISPPRWSPHEAPGAVFGTGMFFRGLSQGRPIPFGEDGHPFQLDHLRAWSPDASVGLVTGRMGNRYGIFELRAGPAADRVPRFLGPINGPIYGTYADDGTGFVANGDVLSILQNHELTPIALPQGAPIPAGPIVWIR